MFLLKIIRRIGILQLLSVLMVVALSLSCSTTPVPDCTSSEADPVFIRWGIIQGKDITGFELNQDSEIRSYKHTLPSLERKYVGAKRETTIENYCRQKKLISETFLKVQTLNAPGKLSHFIEYDNGSGTILRAIWNPEFATKGSAEFREIYQELQTIIADK